jgi:hypothetical protein
MGRLARGGIQLRRVTPGLALAAILAVYVVTVCYLHPTNFFGFSQDDTIYFSSAKALAEGHGYILPSVPGTPPATKYPILYPWLLSWIWKWDPSFPANLAGAVGLDIVFGCTYLVLAFFFLRRLKGVRDGPALLITLFCALNPNLLLASCLIMSDVPFAALALAALVLAARAIRKDNGSGESILAGVLAGLVFLMRVLGAPIAAGIWLAFALRGSWRKAALFAVSALPFAVSLAWRPNIVPLAVAAGAGTACPHSWQMTWLYYTSYSQYWAADTIANHVLWQTLRVNFLHILVQPGTYFLDRQIIRLPMLGGVLLIIVSGLAIRGMIRQGRAGGFQPAHLAFGLYLVPLLIWNYTDPGRFLLPFLPLIVAGLWVETRRLASLVGAGWGKEGGHGDKAACALLCATAIILLFYSAASWRHEFQSVANMSRSRGGLLIEKRQAYSWLAQNSSKDATFVAYEDVSAFLYSARQGMRPVIFSPAAVHRPDIFSAELPCIGSNMQAIGARYWLVSDDDFGSDWEPAKTGAKSKEFEIEKGFPLLFRSARGHVRIYGVARDTTLAALSGSVRNAHP